ncbi:MAG: hypothetical protein JNN11_01800 [Candidatus Doudnabacteria bacterium]|nr:hypothetical protein [Candidatus Doudnabacteria bacterium]
MIISTCPGCNAQIEFNPALGDNATISNHPANPSDRSSELCSYSGQIANVVIANLVAHNALESARNDQ